MKSQSVNGERYKSIVQLAPGIVYTLSKDGAITFLNPSFERITGWKVKDWIGKNFATLIHPDDLELAAQTVKQTLKGERPETFELRIKTKKGTYKTLEFSSGPDIINGEIVGKIGVARDITEFKSERNTNLHYANLIKSADSAIMSRSLGGTITSWNKAAEELFGYSAKEVIGKNFKLLIPVENSGEIEKIDKFIRRGRPLSDYETVRVKKDGTRIPVLAKISPIYDEEGKIVGVSLFDRDNTVMKKEEMADKFLTRATKVLSSSLDYSYTLRRLATILVPKLADWSSVHIVSDEGTPVQLAVAHTDPKKVEWAKKLQKKYGEHRNIDDPNNGVTRVVRTGKSVLYREVTDEMINQAVQKKEDRELIKKLKLRSVVMVPLLSRAGVLGVITLVSTDPARLYDERDLKFAEELGRLAGQAIENARLYLEAQNEIKKRAKIQEELSDSRERLSVILANVADGISVYDEHANVVFVNHAVATASAYKDPGSMLKRPVKWQETFEVMDESGKTLSVKDLPGRRAVFERREIDETVKSINKKTGEEKWANIKARPIIDAEGNFRGAVSITHDITEIKELERKKDDFMSVASHELKTPVTSIKGYVHLLKMYHEKYENNSSYNFLSKIDHQLNKLTELIEDLLNLSRSKSGKLDYNMSEIEISKLVKEVVDDMQVVNSTHKIKLINGVKKKVVADPERISQVIINLLSNAIKYSPNSNKVVVGIKDAGNKLDIFVRDYGIGLDREERDKIFDRFYRVKDQTGRTYPGLGIGLYLSAQIAARHNGKIWVESKKGRGSLFHFELPAIN